MLLIILLKDCVYNYLYNYNTFFIPDVINKTSIDLYRAIVDFDIIWDSISPIDLANTIAKRYSHSTVVDKNSMYVFGGCTCTSTTFNDLWKFNLSTRQFERLLTTGTKTKYFANNLLKD